MLEKVGRNDLCPCGSGKKYKSCCMTKKTELPGKKPFTAKMLNTPKGPPDLMERAFGEAVALSKLSDKPPTPSKLYMRVKVGNEMGETMKKQEVSKDLE